MNLNTLSDREFLRYAHNQLDDLTSTDVERELLRRLEAVDTDTFEAATEIGFSGEDLRQMNEAMDGCDAADVSDVTKLLDAIGRTHLPIATVVELLPLLEAAGITEADELKEALEFATKFRAIANDANDAGDVFTRLTTLITETQED